MGFVEDVISVCTVLQRHTSTWRHLLMKWAGSDLTEGRKSTFKLAELKYTGFKKTLKQVVSLPKGAWKLILGSCDTITHHWPEFKNWWLQLHFNNFPILWRWVRDSKWLVSCACHSQSLPRQIDWYERCMLHREYFNLWIKMSYAYDTFHAGCCRQHCHLWMSAEWSSMHWCWVRNRCS